MIYIKTRDSLGSIDVFSARDSLGIDLFSARDSLGIDFLSARDSLGSIDLFSVFCCEFVNRLF